MTICEHLRCLSQTVQEVIEIFEAKEVPLPKELLDYGNLPAVCVGVFF